MRNYESVVIIGPTASGKTNKAVALARCLSGEIISGDSRQVYRGMNLGTGKDLEDYGDVPYHLIDICEAGEKYNLHRYLYDFNTAYKDIRERGKYPIICGGTGMYVENAIAGVKTPEVPENPVLRKDLSSLSLSQLKDLLSSYKTLHNITDVDTVKRAIRAIEIAEYYKQHPEESESADRNRVKPLNTLVIGIDIPRERRRERITERLHSRLEAGMLDEVKELLKSGIPAEDLIYYGLEYKYLTLCAIGEISYDRMVNELEIAIHQFAKRQMTWFRGMERRGIHIEWLPYNLSYEDFKNEVIYRLEHHSRNSHTR